MVIQQPNVVLALLRLDTREAPKSWGIQRGRSAPLPRWSCITTPSCAAREESIVGQTLDQKIECWRETQCAVPVGEVPLSSS